MATITTEASRGVKVTLEMTNDEAAQLAGLALAAHWLGETHWLSDLYGELVAAAGYYIKWESDGDAEEGTVLPDGIELVPGDKEEAI